MANNLFEAFPGLKLGPQGPGAMQIASGEGLAWANQIKGSDGRTYTIAPNADTGGYDLYPADWKQGDPRMEFGQDGALKNVYTMQDAPSNAQLLGEFALSAGAMAFGIPAMQEAGGAAAAGGAGGFVGEGAASGIPAWDAAGGAVGGTGTLGSSAAPFTFNAAADSQAANAALNLPAVTDAAAPAIAEGVGSSAPWYSQLADKVGGFGSGSAGTGGFSIGPALTSAGAQLIGGYMTNKAVGKAADSMNAATQAGIGEQRRQFDTVRGLLQPYVDAGGRGLASYEALAGTQGPQAQAAAIAALQGTPMYGSTIKAGEDAILQNVAATGGLRGGNVQDALAKFRAGVLTDQVGQQMQRYGSLASMGQNSAAGVGNAALATGNNVTNLLGQQGATDAGAALAGNKAIVNTIGTLGGMWSSQPVVQQPQQQPQQQLPRAF